MADLLVRNVEADVVSRIDAAAEGLGVSRNEFLRRELTRIADVATRRTTLDDVKRSMELLAGLGDETVMERAW